MTTAIQRFLTTADDPNATVDQLLLADYNVVRVLGHDAPYELIRAVGLTPVRLVAHPSIPTPLADALIGTETLGQRGRSILEQILADPHNLPLLITHADAEQTQIFAALRELIRTGDIAPRQIHFLDLLHLPRESSRKYNSHRIQQFVRWIEEISQSKLTEKNWHAAINEQNRLLETLNTAKALRNIEPAKLSAVEYYAIHTSAYMLPLEHWQELALTALELAEQNSASTAERIVITGAPQVNPKVYQTLTDAGYQVVADFQDWGELMQPAAALTADWIGTFSAPERHRPLMLMPAKERVKQLIALAKSVDAKTVIYLINPEDEPSAWDHHIINKWLGEAGLETISWYTNKALPDKTDLMAVALTDATLTTDKSLKKAPDNKKTAPEKRPRSKKSLTSIADFGHFQREWFQTVRTQVKEGAPFAVVGANAPQEILRAMGIPFVVNQWWASIAAAKQQSKRYFALLSEHGYPANVESYSAQGLAAWFDEDETQAPWGGLPKPDFVQAVLSTDATSRIYDHWAQESGAELFIYERSIEPRMEISANWWDRLPQHWDQELEQIRIDLLTEEMRESIACLERQSGQKFDQQKFVEIMHLVNEQEEYYRLTRDLIAKTYPAPVSIADTMPATMVPQWHRGTIWARDAAKSFYEEVKSKVEAGDSVCKDEKLRLMWVGRGMWSDMSFYQRWQESHGAVFIWSMYLSLAADGYIREFDNNRDPMRALAARFLTMGDELRMPTWAGAWHVHEVQTNGIHGAIALSDADPFVLRTLERAGVPVLALQLDNYHQTEQDKVTNNLKIEQFLDKLAAHQK